MPSGCVCCKTEEMTGQQTSIIAVFLFSGFLFLYMLTEMKEILLETGSIVNIVLPDYRTSQR